MVNFPLVASAAAAVLLLVPPALRADEAKLAIETGTVAAIEYTVSDDAGEKLDSNQGGEPMMYVHGSTAVIPGLEKGLSGLHTGDERDLKITPKDGFGEIDPTALQEIPKDKIPAEALQVGAILRASNGQGTEIPVRIAELKEETAVVDFNHPLAGKTLVFHVKILDVKKVEAQPDPPAAAE